MGHILPIITLERYKAVQLDEEYKLRVWDPEAGEFKERMSSQVGLRTSSSYR